METSGLISFNLGGKRALVTGSASGIGLATAQRLARAGARVAMNDLPSDKLDHAVSDLRDQGFSVHAVPGDLSQSGPACAVAQRSAELLGGLDYLVNNAGAPHTRNPIPPEDLDALTDVFWDKILRINLLSAFWMTKTLASALTDAKGAVVNTVSVAAIGGGGSSTPYATAKAGLAGLTRELARGLAPGVRVNGIAPGYVDSNWECSFGDMDAAAKATVPLARVGKTHEYAELIVYLCAGASYITGEVIPVTVALGFEQGDLAHVMRRLLSLSHGLLGLAMASASIAAASPSGGCGKTLASGIYVIDDQHVSRTYRVFVPSKYRADAAQPLIMVFHGWGGD